MAIIPDLPAKTSLSSTDLLVIDDGDHSYNITWSAFSALLKTVASFAADPDQTTYPGRLKLTLADGTVLRAYAADPAKQDLLTWDNTPTANSNNPVKSGGIKAALDEKLDADDYVPFTGATGSAAGTAGTVPAPQATGKYLSSDGAWETPDTTPTAGSDKLITSGAVRAAIDASFGSVIYGFHINGAESDPSAAVTYLADAAGMTPAYMDYANDQFIWGSWRDAFFIPRPCMLKYDGSVDYYLDPDDYTKKMDGSASDVDDDAYGGNAMMEWGRHGKKIWYKIVPDPGDNTSASVYIADYQADSDYHAWSFINNQGVLVPHFYTAIYNGSIDANGKLRSISGKGYADLCQSKTPAEEVAAAELNNPSTDKLWYTEVYADVTLINLLLIMLGKSLDSQAVFGKGRGAQTSAASSMLGTGVLDGSGLFFGYNDNTHAVKIFGMENWWGNQTRRYAGHIMSGYIQKYKLTRGRQDGSASDDYVQSTTAADYNGYLTGATGPSANGLIAAMRFLKNCFQPAAVGGSTSTYWTDNWYQNTGLRYVRRGGSASTNAGYAGAFNVALGYGVSTTDWSVGAAPSCKPMG